MSSSIGSAPVTHIVIERLRSLFRSFLPRECHIFVAFLYGAIAFVLRQFDWIWPAGDWARYMGLNDIQTTHTINVLIHAGTGIRVFVRSTTAVQWTAEKCDSTQVDFGAAAEREQGGRRGGWGQTKTFT